MKLSKAPSKTHTLSELVEEWGISLNKIIRHVDAGDLQTHVMYPLGDEDSGLSFEFSEWHKVSRMAITEGLARGIDFIEKNAVIDSNSNGQTYSLRKVPFSELIVLDSEKIRFEKQIFANKDVSSVADGNGNHWAQKRYDILCAAFQTINEELSNLNSDIFIGEKNKKRINAAKLAALVDQHRDRWPDLKNRETKGLHLKNIEATIQKALQKP